MLTRPLPHPTPLRLAAAMLALTFVAGPARAETVQDANPAAGVWAGRISAPPAPLQVTVTLSREAASGAWSGTIDIPAQGARGLKLSDISIDGRSAVFSIAGVPGNPTFVGTVSENGEQLAGTFTQGGAAFPFELRRAEPGAAAATLPRPQQPKPPFPYREEQVTFRNDAANIGLAGTLTLPKGQGPFPAVLLISGSGTQDRDSTIFDHKPFLLLADTLTRRGVAVLRVDDRGIGGSDRGTIEPTSADLAGDVRAGLAYLDGRTDIDSAKLGLVGLSEGANIAAMVAAGAGSPSPAFIVMLAGSGVRGDELLVQQVTAIASAQGVPEEVIAWDLDMRRAVYRIVNAETDGQPNEAARQALIDSVRPIPGAPDASTAREGVAMLFKASSGRWFRYFLAYDPRLTLERVKVPVLALIGGNDRQVPAAGNLAAIRAAFAAGGNTDVTVRELPGLNHLFQTSQTGSPTEYAAIEETMAPAALTLVADWIVERVK